MSTNSQNKAGLLRTRVPDTLQSRPQWALWTLEDGDKVPCQIDGHRARSNDSETWSPLRAVLETYDPNRHDGLAFFVSAEDDLVAIDLDDCIEEDQLTGKARQIVETIDSWTEISQSGNGLHIIARGYVPPGHRCKCGNIEGMEELEMYTERRFFALTLNHLEGTPDDIKLQPNAIGQLYEQYFKRERSFRSVPTPTRDMDLSDQELLERIRNSPQGSKFEQLWNGDTSMYDNDHSRADYALLGILAFWTQGDRDRMDKLFTQSGLGQRDKWRDREDYRKRSIDNVLAEQTEFYDPHYNNSPLTNGRPQHGETEQASRTGDEEIFHRFWSYDDEKRKVHIDHTGLLEFIADRGYGKAYFNDADESTFLRVIDDYRVRKTSREKMKDHILQYVKRLPGKVTDNGCTRRQLLTKLVRGDNVYFSTSKFQSLSPQDIEFQKDTVETAYLYYQNCFVEITPEEIVPRPYEDLEGKIWDRQIIPRPFTLNHNVHERPRETEFGRFLWLVTGEDNDRFKSLASAIGYLIHGYKDRSRAKAIALMDEQISDLPSGRTGKSIIGQALSHMVPFLRLDGRNFSFDGRFAFQDVELDTAIVDFNDAPEDFTFDRLFSMITDDMQIEEKNQKRRTIPFEDSPKFLISTNFVIEGDGGSHSDRLLEIEFAPHFTPDHKPVDEFGRRLFEEWDAGTWNEFDNLMAALLHTWMRNGFHYYQQVNIKHRKLRQETTPEFAEFSNRLEPGEYSKKGLYLSFIEEYPEYGEEGRKLWKGKFTGWMKTYARIYGLEYDEGHSMDYYYYELLEKE